MPDPAAWSLPSPSPVLLRPTVGRRKQILSPSPKEFASHSASRTHGPPMENGNMNLAQEYDRWHEQVIAANTEHADETSPWYRLVFEHMRTAPGKEVLGGGCGRGGFA